MTSSRWITILAGFSLASVLTLQSSAQQGPAPPGVIRINVNLVQVDAVITDSKGEPVTDLKAEDFELLQDGQPQKITNLEFIRIKSAAPATSAVQLTVTPARNGVVVPPPPQTREVRREQIRRTIALVADDLALSFDSIVRVRDSMKTWVDREMQPGDLVAVVRTSTGMGSLQRFTMDKRALQAAIELLQFHGGRVGVSERDPQLVRDEEVFRDQVNQVYVLASLGAIQSVVRGLRGLPGRKSLILFSQSMRFTIREGGPLGLESSSESLGDARMQRLADEANRSSVVIYAIDPRGVPIDDWDLRASRDGMFELTHRTGGLFVRDSNDFDAMLRQAVDDGDGYYLIGYEPEGSTFEDENGKPKFHKISVRVKRPGLAVRSRTGFLGRPDVPKLPDAEARRVQIVNALVSPFASGDVRVRLTGLYFSSDAEVASIKALVHFDVQDLTFTEQPDGFRTAKVDIAVVTFDADGEPVNKSGETSTIRVSRDEYQDILEKGLVYTKHVPVNRAGGYELRVAVRDTASQRVGSAMQFVAVPDVSNGRLTLSGILISPELSQAPSAESSNGGPADLQRLEGTPGLRIFKAGSAMAYSYQVLNARADTEKMPQLEYQIRLFRDGEQIYAGRQLGMNVEGLLRNPKRLVARGRMALTEIPPGNYVMQIVVADNLRYDNYRIAAQAIDFEVRP